MTVSLLAAALLMGATGGPHCVAMCGAACSGVVRLCGAGPERGGPAFEAPLLPAARVGRSGTVVESLWLFMGRVAGYALAGALVATAANGLAVASEHVSALKPLWVLLHVFVLAWGLLLLGAGRQPLWSRHAGRAIAGRLRLLAGRRIGLAAIGAMWAAMPCGLLYSALMLASLADGPWQGALAMTVFAAASGLSLFAAPWVLLRFGWRLDALRQGRGVRLAGLLLAASASAALWLDLRHQIDAWCR